MLYTLRLVLQMAKDYRIAMLLDMYGGFLTDKQQLSLDYYYNEDLTLSEIAEHMEITRQGVRDNIKRAEIILLELDEKLGLFEKQSRLAEKKQSLLEAIDSILSAQNIIAKPVVLKLAAIREIVEGIEN